MVSVQMQQEFAYVGQDIALHCTSESYPLAIHFWQRSNGTAISSGKLLTQASGKKSVLGRSHSFEFVHSEYSRRLSESTEIRTYSRVLFEKFR